MEGARGGAQPPAARPRRRMQGRMQRLGAQEEVQGRRIGLSVGRGPGLGWTWAALPWRGPLRGIRPLRGPVY